MAAASRMPGAAAFACRQPPPLLRLLSLHPTPPHAPTTKQMQRCRRRRRRAEVETGGRTARCK
eukprot:scaffold227199_cov24-Tisochrysis_lutea.AAC.3